MSKCLIGFVLLIVSTLSFAAENTVSYELKNGLKIIVREDNRSPVVTSQIWYKVGSAYEPQGITGISHVVEHMMFKGTPSHPAKAFFESISELGGSQNAFTFYDFTAYHQTVESSNIELLFKLEADRMQNLNFVNEEFLKEIEVVKEERHLRTDDNPEALGHESFYMAAFMGGNPYSHPVVGWKRDLDQLNLKDVKDWYKTWYTPNNAIIVVVGNVTGDKVLSLAKKHFETIPVRQVPQVKTFNDIKPLGLRRTILDFKTRVPVMYIGFNVPVLSSESSNEVYALKVAEAALGLGRSSRLAKKSMREEGICSNYEVNYHPFHKYPTLFEFAVTPNENISMQQLELGILNQVNRLKEEVLSRDELERIKTQIISAKILSEDSMSHQAYLLGSLEASGYTWELSKNYIENIQSVTSDQVMHAVQKYLQPNRMTITQLLSNSNESSGVL